MNPLYIVAPLILGLLLTMAILLLSARGSWLISGYNTLSKKDRERYDQRALCRYVGWFMLVLTAAVAMMFADEIWPGKGLFIAGQILLWYSIIFSLIWCNTGGRFLKK